MKEVVRMSLLLSWMEYLDNIRKLQKYVHFVCLVMDKQ